jgi:hypothetical protein
VREDLGFIEFQFARGSAFFVRLLWIFTPMKKLADDNKRLLDILKERGFLLAYNFDAITNTLKLDLTPDGEHLSRLIQKLYPDPDVVNNADIINLATFFMCYHLPPDPLLN